MKRVGMHGAGMISPSVMGGIAPLSGEYYLDFNGTSSFVNCGSDASIDNLPTAAFTLDFWLRFDTVAQAETVFDKRPVAANGFLCAKIGGGNLQFILYYTITSRVAQFAVPDTNWHHWAFTYDESVDRLIRLWLDGTLRNTSAATAGNYVPDAAQSLYCGRNAGAASGYMDGALAWIRFSKIRRWTANFVAPLRCVAPAVDANTVELWTLNDGGGNTARASVNSPANDGAITDGTWYNC